MPCEAMTGYTNVQIIALALLKAASFWAFSCRAFRRAVTGLRARDSRSKSPRCRE